MIFYDFEVFAQDWLVVFMNTASKETTTIINSRPLLEIYYNNHKNDIFAGWNSQHYDQYIFKGILLGYDPKILNDFIIHQGQQGWKFSKDFYKFRLNNYDVKLRDDRGLKAIEGFLGQAITECAVDFDIDRKLTDDELKTAAEYCACDVEQTIRVFLQRKEEFNAHLGLLKAFNLPLGYVSKTKPQIAAAVLKAEKWARDDAFDLKYPYNLDLGKYRYVLDWFKNTENHKATASLVTDVAGISHVFGWGGIHGALYGYHAKGNILALDVVSYYPSLMIKYDLLSRSATDKDKYRQIYEKRLELKAADDPMSVPYKRALNSVYGACRDKYNALYDARQANLVSMYGQLFLLDLIEKLEPYCQLIQSNTDGLIIRWHDSDALDGILSVWEIWSDRTGLELEFNEYSAIWQKDVNNYVMHGYTNKFAGAYVKESSPLDNDLPIVSEAVRQYFLTGTHPAETISNCEDLLKYQKIVSIRELADKAALVADGYNVTELKERTLRVFASNDPKAGKLYKLKLDGRREKIANTPDRCFIDNGAMTNKKLPAMLDRQYYVDLAVERVESFNSL